MNNSCYFVGFILICALFTACAPHTAKIQSNINVPDHENSVALKPGQRYIASDPLVVQQSRTQAGRFNGLVVFLADQLERNADRKTLGNTFIVTSFVNLNKLSETNGLGRLIAENLIHELQVRKWQVFDVRMTNDILVTESGEFSLSRDIKKIKEFYKVGGIVTGTYTVANEDIIVNARCLNINTGMVASSGQVRMAVDGFTGALINKEDSIKSMMILGDGFATNGK